MFAPAAAALLFSIVSARADDGVVINRCHSALLVADRKLSDLLADDVRIKLDDLGVVPSKQEFIASINEWQRAVASATIRHRIEKSEGGITTVIASYDFPNNDMLMQETFAVTNNRIIFRRRRSPRTAMATEQGEAGRDIACDKPAPYIGGNPASPLYCQSARDRSIPSKSLDLAARPLTAWHRPLGLPDFARIGDC